MHDVPYLRAPMSAWCYKLQQQAEANAATCTHCGICAVECPMGAIKLAPVLQQDEIPCKSEAASLTQACRIGNSRIPLLTLRGSRDGASGQSNQ